MAFWKRRSRGSFVPASNDRLAVVYLGQHPVVESTGLDDASSALNTLYRNYKEGKGGAERVTVEVMVNGLVINKIKGFSPPSDPSTSSKNRIILAAVKMFFGATDPAHPKIFFVVKRREGDTNSMDNNNNECHGFLCDTTTAAHTLALRLMEMFNNAGDAETKSAYQKSYDYAMVRSHQQQQEKGLLRSQSLNLPRSRGRQEAVSTIKITMNVEHGTQPGLAETKNNSEIARIIAKRENEQMSSGADEGSGSPAVGRSRRSASSRSDKGVAVDLVSKESPGAESKHKPIVTFNPSQPGSSPSKLLRQSQLSTVKEQSPSSSPKQSPKERRMAASKADDAKENQQVDDNDLTNKSNKRKSVRFAEDAEII